MFFLRVAHEMLFLSHVSPQANGGAFAFLGKPLSFLNIHALFFRQDLA